MSDYSNGVKQVCSLLSDKCELGKLALDFHSKNKNKKGSETTGIKEVINHLENTKVQQLGKNIRIQYLRKFFNV